MKIGILLTAYNFSDMIDSCLRSWVDLKNELDLEICAVSLPFEEYKGKNIDEDNTAQILTVDYKIKTITEPRFIDEASARSLAFDKLKEKCDYVWLLDADEIYYKEDIIKIVNFIKSNPEIYYFHINFKNYVFDGDCWIDGFCPPRIFKTKYAKGFYWDNDMTYDINGQDISYKQMSRVTIPKSIAHIKHLTWINSERSKNKIKYQEEHFKSGLGCSYKWNDQKDCLEFNEEYYKKSGIIKPKLNYE